ncbi:ABC transporter ATP-binding protein [Sutcliffiella halmapala]|uniref:ABC transporter ATP-binding protein n=1 Tax=Sutcliffiella halmapala TaxID=79882 RepID=UPI00099557D2|nr:ABC transporter ATP-binding protein [Sutcliffiella halmapala]
MKAIECKELSKVYWQRKALNDLSFTIEENTITGLIGRNGAGKTTLLKIIAGFLSETAGEIKVFGEEPFNNLTVSANSIFVDDFMSLPTSLNLEETLEAAGKFYAKWDGELAKRLFDYFSFDPKQRHEFLSKGMKSTFNMIIGLASRCSLTIFDEPTTGMDAAVRKDFYRALLKDYLAHPRTIILSSHHLDEIEDLIEDVLLLDGGKKRLHLSAADLKEYAIGLTGKASLLEEWTSNKEVLFTKSIGTDSRYVVMENDWTEESVQEARQLGIDITPVSASDVCVYVTGNTKGGIDDVFN